MAFRTILNKLFRFKSQAFEEGKIKLVDRPSIGSASFHLLLGFDVDVDPKTKTVKVYVNKQILTSEGERARSFLNALADGELKGIVADLCLAASKHVLAHNENVSRTEIAGTTATGPHLPN